jgi:dihydrofolate reductase
MGKLVEFNSVSLDGFFTDASGGMQWAYNPTKDAEWDAFIAGNARGGGVLVFGRRTYDLMKSYWPTPIASRQYPEVAERMNTRRKIVFSRTLQQATWNNTTLLREGMASETRKMKQELDEDLVILGSGSVVSQLSGMHLIDEYQFVVVPVILGAGRTLFDGVRETTTLELLETRVFVNGNVFLRYAPRSSRTGEERGPDIP